MYEQVGILDVRDFYKDKFVFYRNFDFTNKTINYYDIDNFKFLWMYSNIKENTKVLDFGCGSGTLSCLKKKGCEITGIDYSVEALNSAKNINGYDYVHSVDIFDYDNYGYFDYVVSLDLLGHIPFEDKDKLISQLKRFLKPGGTMLHGIECGQVYYSAMSQEELKKFIEVDGHVGIEDKLANINRFKKFFNFVTGEVRYDICNSVGEYIKQSTSYGSDAWKSELIEYLSIFDENEVKAFNLASGLTQIAIENKNLPSPSDAGGFLFLKASDNEIKHVKMEIGANLKHSQISSFIENDDVFLKGWWSVESEEPKKFRWSTGKSYCLFQGYSGKNLNFEIFSGYPKIEEKPVEVFLINNKTKELICSVVLSDNRTKKINIPLNDEQFVLQILCDLTWVPNLLMDSPDSRELGIGIFNVSIDNELKHSQMEIVGNSEHSEISSFIENDDVFWKGWWSVESEEPKKFRWSTGKSYCLFQGYSGKNLNFEIFSGYPKIEEKPVEVFLINNKTKKLISSVVLSDNRAKKINIPLTDDKFVLKILCDLTWIPNLLMDTADSRELGIGIFNVSIQ